ncbi:Hypothetical predicted protein [Marmota monax]|uniref:Uncharacterized protein n=1 Tax=Marmota monax TaxID=9995 RepID=A0A5E4AXZ8_MARMO|nr:hypothetical protein GHT09_008037 [Marmota monax]VTJ62055.1 Hypothetical predicted protein [Marmota monax]
MAAVIIPAAEGMGGNFLLFYPAIPTGVDIPPPSPVFSSNLEELEPRGSQSISRAGGMAMASLNGQFEWLWPDTEGIWGARADRVGTGRGRSRALLACGGALWRGFELGATVNGTFGSSAGGSPPPELVWISLLRTCEI